MTLVLPGVAASQLHRQLPMLPVLVPLGVLVFLALVRLLARRRALTAPRALVAATVTVYGCGILAHTVFPVYLDGGNRPSPWWRVFHLMPFAGTDGADMAANVLVFLPLGVLVPLMVRGAGLGRVVAVGFGVSLAMELTQFVNSLTGRAGHVADVNDLLANTLGAGLGFGLFVVLARLPGLGALVRAATWPPRSRAVSAAPV